jgi:hypothetical protein
MRDFFRTGAAALVFAMAGAASAGPVKVGDTMEGVRNARYCEIIPVVRKGLHCRHRLQHPRP